MIPYLFGVFRPEYLVRWRIVGIFMAEIFVVEF